MLNTSKLIVAKKCTKIPILTVNLISDIYLYKRNDIVPDSFTEFSNNASQGKEGLVDGAAFTESVPRVLTSLL